MVGSGLNFIGTVSSRRVFRDRLVGQPYFVT
jgi:hypothetical protein